MTPTQKLKKIANIIEQIDNRAMECDGPVTPTRLEMTDKEMRKIYELAGQESDINQQILKCQKDMKNIEANSDWGQADSLYILLKEELRRLNEQKNRKV